MLERTAEQVRVSLVRIGILPVQSTGYEHAEQRILEAIAQHQVTSPAFATLLLQVFLLFSRGSLLELQLVLWHAVARGALISAMARFFFFCWLREP